MTETYIPTDLQSHIDWLLDKVRQLQERCEIIPMEQIENMFPEGEWAALSDGTPEFTLPMSFALISSVREIMAMAFPEYELTFDHQFLWEDSGQAGHFLHYRPDGRYSHEFSFGFRSNVEGSTCVLNKIGEAMKPVYEVVCSEAAAKEFTHAT